MSCLLFFFLYLLFLALVGGADFCASQSRGILLGYSNVNLVSAWGSVFDADLHGAALSLVIFVSLRREVLHFLLADWKLIHLCRQQQAFW